MSLPTILQLIAITMNGVLLCAMLLSLYGLVRCVQRMHSDNRPSRIEVHHTEPQQLPPNTNRIVDLIANIQDVTGRRHIVHATVSGYSLWILSEDRKVNEHFADKEFLISCVDETGFLTAVEKYYVERKNENEA